jgi:hypothetical protein
MRDRPLIDLSHLLDERNNLPLLCEPDATGWVPDGLCVACEEDGTIFQEMTYVNGIADGPYRSYWPNGLLDAQGQYVNGMQEGEWIFQVKNHDKPIMIIYFEEGKEVINWDFVFKRTLPLS